MPDLIPLLPERARRELAKRIETTAARATAARASLAGIEAKAAAARERVTALRAALRAGTAPTDPDTIAAELASVERLERAAVEQADALAAIDAEHDRLAGELLTDDDARERARQQHASAELRADIAGAFAVAAAGLRAYYGALDRRRAALERLRRDFPLAVIELPPDPIDALGAEVARALAEAAPTLWPETTWSAGEAVLLAAKLAAGPLNLPGAAALARAKLTG